MKRLLLVLPLLAATALFVGCPLIYDTPFTRSNTETFKVSNGYATINVDNEVGNVRVLTTDEDEIVVTYDRKCWGTSMDDAEEHVNEIYVFVEGNQSTGVITVEGRVPDADLDVRRYEVDFTIYVPDTMSVDINNITGDVELNNLRRKPAVEVTTGTIDINGFKCEVDAKITTGVIDCTIDSLPAGGNVTLRATSGDQLLKIAAMDTTSSINIDGVTSSVEVYLPSDVQLDFDLETTTGAVTINDYDYDQGGVWSNIHKVGTIGGAATRSSLDVLITTGDITLGTFK